MLPALIEKGISVYLLADTCSTEGIVPLAQKISQASEQPLSPDQRANVTVKSTALYIYTSGTTGRFGSVVNESVRMNKFLRRTNQTGSSLSFVSFVS